MDMYGVEFFCVHRSEKKKSHPESCTPCAFNANKTRIFAVLCLLQNARHTVYQKVALYSIHAQNDNLVEMCCCLLGNHNPPKVQNLPSTFYNLLKFMYILTG